MVEADKRHADSKTIDHIVDLTKQVNALRQALLHISHIDGSDPVEEIRLARKLARRALWGHEDVWLKD